MKNLNTKFKALIGLPLLDEQGEEIWTDNGCIYSNHRDAKRVANNMAASYQAGVDDTKSGIKSALRL